jgi:hypothetical protein
VPDERREVERGSFLLDFLEIARQVGAGAAAVARDHGGHAVGDEIARFRTFQDGALDVGVDVDEAGGDDAVAGVDYAGGRGAGEASDGRDPSGGDGDVGATPGVARAVQNAGVADEEVVLAECGGGGQGEED